MSQYNDDINPELPFGEGSASVDASRAMPSSTIASEDARSAVLTGSGTSVPVRPAVAGSAISQPERRSDARTVSNHVGIAIGAPGAGRIYPNSGVFGDANDRAGALSSARPAGYSQRSPVSVAASSAAHDGARTARGTATEVFAAHQVAPRTFTKYTPVGRATRAAKTFSSDLTVGKFGVLAIDEAEMLEAKLLASFAHDQLALTGKSFAFKEEFLRTLYLFLAINSGSIGNVTGRMGLRDDSQPLRFADAELAAADVAAILGDRAYSYMRARATQIRDTIESAFATTNLPNAEFDFPGVCNAVDLIKVAAAAKGLSQYPQYVAVGSQYAAGTPPYLIDLILESASKVLGATQGNVRESSGSNGRFASSS